MKNNDHTNNYIIAFISGFGLGTVAFTAYYYFTNLTIIEKKIFIKISDTNGEVVIKDYYFNRNTETLHFKEQVDKVNIKIIIGDKIRHECTNFTGNKLCLKNL